MDLIDYIAKLSDKASRQKAAKALARYLHAKNLIIFTRDLEMDVLLPGPGFYQVLPNSKVWKEFINRKGSVPYEGLFPEPESGELTSSVGIPSVNGSIAVLIGGSPSVKGIDELQRILPIISTLLQEEQKLESFAGIAKVAEKSSEKSERLAIALDAARMDLLKSLDENSVLLKKLQERNSDLERINNELDNFVYTASHDLKAPISNIEGLIHILNEYFQGKEDEEVYEVVRLMTNAVEKFKSTILDLTDVTKLQRDIEGDNADKIDVKEMINELQLLLAKDIEYCNASIHVEIEENELFFSRKNLWSILNNLLSNAIKYRALNRKPEIKIVAKREIEYFLLEVSDNGLGIKKDSIYKLFTMFRRFHDHVEGSGIGLYLVKRIVENSDGRVEVESKEGVGSVFKIYLRDITVRPKNTHLTNA